MNEENKKAIAFLRYAMSRLEAILSDPDGFSVYRNSFIRALNKADEYGLNPYIIEKAIRIYEEITDFVKEEPKKLSKFEKLYYKVMAKLYNEM